MAVSKRLRFEILRRDNHTCRYCGGVAPNVTLTVDHVIPVALGGNDDPGNLVAACRECNSGKSSVPGDAPTVANVATDAMRWAKAMAQVANERALRQADANAMYDAFLEEWDSWTNGYGRTTPKPEAWRSTIDQILKAGLTIDDLIELTRVAMESKADDTWRYFCGCCWRRIKQDQERAQEIIAGQEQSPKCEPLATVWTTDDIDQQLASGLSTAGRWLHQESIDSAHCDHRDWGQGDCGDPICRSRRAEALGWMSYANMRESDRDDAVMDAADELEFADG